MDRHRGSGSSLTQRRVVAGIVVVAVVAVAGVAGWMALGPAPSAGPAVPNRSPSQARSGPESMPPPNEQLWSTANWESIGNPFAPARPPALRIDGLVHGGDLLLGWGRYPAPDRNQFMDIGAVFRSRDGVAWEAVPIAHGVNGPSTSELLGIAVGGLGYLAYGGVCCEPQSSALWHSVDGEDWTRQEVAGDMDPFDVYFRAVVGLEDGWVAAGHSLDGRRGEIWRSGDGVSWEAVLSEEGGRPGFTVADLAKTADGVVAVGTVTGPDGTYDGAIWRSADGRVWERVAEDDAALAGEGEEMPERVVAHPGGLFLVGAFGTSEERSRCEDLAVASMDPRPPVGLSCGLGGPHTWAMDEDGAVRLVNQLEADADEPIEYRVVAAGGPGLVVLGESAGPASPDTNLFVSADGIEWTLVGPLLPMGQAVAMGMVVRGREIVAVTDLFDGISSQMQVWIGRVE